MLRRLVKSVSAIFAGQLLNIVGNLALVPLFLSHWSTSLYGEWIALSAVVAYLGISDLGMSSAAGNVMTAAYAQRDLARYRSLQGSAMAFYLGMALSISVVLAIVAALLPLPAWCGIRDISPSVAAASIWLLGATVLWQMPAAQLRCIYRTTGNLSTTEWFWNLQFFLSIVSTATVLVFHGGVLQLAFFGMVPTGLVSIVVWLALRRFHPELLPSLSAARFAGVLELLTPSLLFGLITLSLALAFQGPVLIVAKTLGGTAVALLVTTRTLSNLVRQAINTMQAAIWPELTRLGVLGAAQTLRLSHRLFSVGTATLTASFGAALWFEGPSVIQFWTRGHLTPDVWLLRFFLLALALQAPWVASSAFASATNRHRNLAFSCARSAVLTIVFTLFLIRPLGLIAVPIGTIAAEAMACYHFIVRDVCKDLEVHYPRFALQIWQAVAAISLAAWAAGYLGHAIAVGPSPLRWVEVGAFTTLAAAATSWVLALRPDERSKLAAYARTRYANFWGAESHCAA